MVSWSFRSHTEKRPKRQVAVRPSMPTRATHRRSNVVVRVAQEMSDDEAFWDTQATDAQLFDRVVQCVAAKDVKNLSEDGWKVLDVRPPTEAGKVHLCNAVEVPLWVPDTSMHPVSLVKRMSAFGMCGWWLGAEAMAPNENFLEDVQAQLPLDAKVLVTCQSGIRSKDAAAQLARVGYQNLAWVKGGLNSSKAGEVATLDGADVRLAGIGGVSSLIKWTKLQQENAGPLGGWRTSMAIIGALWLINILTLSVELRPLWQHLQETNLF